MSNVSQILKYVIVRPQQPILFSLELKHADVVTRFASESAGYCCISYKDGRGVVTCWGESTSLGISSRESKDARIIQQLVNLIPVPVAADVNDWAKPPMPVAVPL